MYNQHKILRVFQLINLLKSSPPKSISHLAKTLAVDNRSVYRYLDLLRVLGFKLDKNVFNRYLILSKEQDADFSFSPEESIWLKGLILTAGKDSIFCDSVLKKLYVNSEINIKGEQVYKAHLSNLVQEITKGIETNKQIILKKYYSANSQNIGDRLVEPIHFTDQYEHLVAFEVSTKLIKHFHIERISAVEILITNMQFCEQHKNSKQDVFGFAMNEQQHQVDLWLSLRAYLFLKEEYPNTVHYLKYDKRRKQYRFVVTVNNLAPVERFIKGLEGEITVNNLD